MANYCMNTLEVIADNPKELQKFIKKYFTKNKENNELQLDFEKVIPHPKSLEECPERYKEKNYDPDKPTSVDEYGCDINPWFNWYDFNIENWGTKWNCFDTYISISSDKTSLILDYNTAWAPADKVIEKLIEKNPKLKIENAYYEPGNCFCGKISSIPSETWYFEADNAVDLMMKACELDFESRESVYEYIMSLEDAKLKKLYLAKYFPETIKIKPKAKSKTKKSEKQ